MRQNAPFHRWQPTAYAPWILAGVLAALYTQVSLLRSSRMETSGYDLGIFDQAVSSYAHLKAPMVPLKGYGENLLGDHFHPVLALLAPFYRLWPHTTTLLIAQALLVAISAVPVTRFAMDRLGARRGVAVGVAYGLSFGVQTAVGFDFHEVAFAVPLLAFGMVALAEQRWRCALAWTLPLLLVKEDMGLTVAAVGLVLVLRRKRLVGAVVAALGVTTMLVLTMVVIPALNHLRHRYDYWALVGNAGSGTAPSAGRLFDVVISLPQAMVSPPLKLALPALLLGITAFAALRSSITLVAVPTVVLHVASASTPMWSIHGYHYNVILMPVLFVAMVEGVGLLRRGRRRWLRQAARWVPAVSVAVCVAFVPVMSFWRIETQPRFAAGHVAAARRLASMVPDGASVSATDKMVPLVVDRCTTYTFSDPIVPPAPPSYVLVDLDALTGQLPAQFQLQAFFRLASGGYRLVAEGDDVYLFDRAHA